MKKASYNRIVKPEGMKANIIAAIIIALFLLTVYACKKEKHTETKAGYGTVNRQ